MFVATVLVALIGSRICTTKKRLIIVYTVSAVLALCVILALYAYNWFAGSSRSPGQALGFKEPRHTWLVEGGFRFTRLDGAQIARVRITPGAAAQAVIAEYGLGHGSRVTFESLGGYVDTSEIIQDWVGTTPWIPKAVPAYLVRIHGVARWSLGPKVPVAPLTFCNVIVKASSSVTVEATCSH